MRVVWDHCMGHMYSRRTKRKAAKIPPNVLVNGEGGWSEKKKKIHRLSCTENNFFFLLKEILLPLLNSFKIPQVCWWMQSLCDFNSDRKELLQRINEPWKRKQISVVQNSALGGIIGDFPSQTGGERAGRGSPRECKLDERGGTKHC